MSIGSSLAARTSTMSRRVRKNLNLLLRYRTINPVGVSEHQVNGLKLALDFTAPNHRQIYEQGAFESELTETIDKMSRDGDIFVDIGANFGWHSLSFLQHRPDAQVYAFEPSRKMFLLLSRSLKINGYEDRCHASRVALSNRQCTSTLKTFSALDPMHASLFALADWACEEEEVELDTLDSQAEKFMAPPTLIKCDVEGGERDVLLGARDIMSGKHGVPPVWFLEANYEASGMAGFFPWDLLDIAARCAPYEGFCIREGAVKALISRTSLRHGDTLILAIPEMHRDRLSKVTTA